VKVIEELFWQPKGYKDMRHVEETVNERSFRDTVVMNMGQRKFISLRRIYDYKMHDPEFESLLG